MRTQSRFRNPTHLRLNNIRDEDHCNRVSDDSPTETGALPRSIPVLPRLMRRQRAGLCAGGPGEWLADDGEQGPGIRADGSRQEVGSRFACAVNSCTSALHLGLEAMGVQAGDKVLVPTMTFTASAEVVRYLGADPVFLDVEYGSSLVTPEILPGHRPAPGRQGPDRRALRGPAGTDARRGGAARAPGDLPATRSSGSSRTPPTPSRRAAAIAWSAASATRPASVSTPTRRSRPAKAGMLTTDDEAIAARARVMRLHGIDRDVWTASPRPSRPGNTTSSPPATSTTCRTSTPRSVWPSSSGPTSCAIGASRSRPATRTAGRAEALDLPLVRVPPEDHAWHLFVVVVKPTARLGRDRLIELLAERGIGTSVTYKPLHRMSYYRDRYGLDAADFPSGRANLEGMPGFADLSEPGG